MEAQISPRTPVNPVVSEPPQIAAEVIDAVDQVLDALDEVMALAERASPAKAEPALH